MPSGSLTATGVACLDEAQNKKDYEINPFLRRSK
jgi:hypothetical protein